MKKTSPPKKQNKKFQKNNKKFVKDVITEMELEYLNE